MTESDTAPPDGSSDEQLVRNGLHALVADVEPSATALPRVLAGRRRRTGVRTLLGVTGAVAATTAALLLTLVFLVDRTPPTVPAGTAPDSYVAQLADGTLVSVMLETGEVRQEFGRPGAEITALARGEKHVYAATADGGVLRMGAAGSFRRMRGVVPGDEVTAIDTSEGRLAVASGNRVALVSRNTTRRITLSAELVVRDLALDRSGRLALVVGDRTISGPPTLRVVPAGGDSAVRLDTFEVGCGPLRTAWTSTGLAVLRPIECAVTDAVRITTIDPATGSRIGGGVHFGLDRPLGAIGDIRVSTDATDRILVATTSGRMWLVDGAGVDPATGQCASRRDCTSVPPVM
ncbi:hypothetical protein SAMN04487820_11164 [Actinopolyspora mzabensis]|uniref:FbpC C-terminal regulatory nucleotide binding domain-containing protein n=1 Tax=Actinopolyspora mzabensis TaxID=995066 RepID=A0A1G9E1G7_ACTMZ|nr:hypothetical protein [Actinopolyspora mzabensis]SDK69949.1 hypothetical protein SAMN04487820_11164 [Actinopolyspora mzabensis]